MNLIKQLLWLSALSMSGIAQPTFAGSPHQRIVAPAPEFGVPVPNRFGQAIAAHGSLLLAGAPGEDVPGVADAGVAYLFELVGDTYVQRTRLFAPNAASGDAFGSAIALSENIAVVGAKDVDLPSGSGVGSAYVFERNGFDWILTAQLFAPDPATADNFGNAVAVSGNAIVVGALSDDINGIGVNVGSAHLFQRIGGNWQHTARLLANDPSINARFGRAVAISFDQLMIGSSDVDGGAGAVYVYTFDSTSVQFHARLIADDRAANDEFGAAIAIDGNTATVGASKDDAVSAQDAGAAYVFNRVGSQWTQQAKLVSISPQPGERLGYSVAVLGGFALAGSPYSRRASCCEHGSASLFLGSASGEWRHLRRLTAVDAAPFDLGGYSVALTESGPLAGAPDSNDSVSNADATGSVIRHERGLSLFCDGFEKVVE